MIKTLLPFYIICFVLYVFFSRQPDYQDGEFTNGIIQYSVNQNKQQLTLKAMYNVDRNNYAINASYPFRNLLPGKNVKIIYDSSNPQNAAIYTWWGYWLQWDELLASVFIPFVLFFAASAITKNPTPEALLEDMAMDNPVKRRKYD